MKQFSYTITAPDGIHAVPASLLVQKASQYNSFITISKETIEADMTKVMKLLSLNISQGDLVVITAEGEDEDLAISELKFFFEQYL